MHLRQKIALTPSDDKIFGLCSCLFEYFLKKNVYTVFMTNIHNRLDYTLSMKPSNTYTSPIRVGTGVFGFDEVSTTMKYYAYRPSM